MSGCPYASRRGFLGAAGGLLAAGAIAPAAAAPAPAAAPADTAAPTVAFWGEHQAGIATPTQAHTYLAALDVTGDSPAALAALLRDWTLAAARLAEGRPAMDAPAEASRPGGDSGETLGMAPARLTLTFGLGATLFHRDGQDRFGLGHQRPEALLDLPAFPGDQLEPARSGGDLSVQACAEDPQVAFHAVRQLVRIAGDRARLRWTQAGFSARAQGGATPRNLLGFRDGTNNPGGTPEQTRLAGSLTDPVPLDRAVWVGEEGPGWMRGGSYAVFRRIRFAIEHWDATPVDFQEQVVGRRKASGAPLGGTAEFDPIDLDATGPDGLPAIPENAHVRLASAAANGGAAMLRRGYAYNDGVNVIAERWPPWRQGLEYDAGLLFVAYQRDVRRGFLPVFQKMSRLDALNQYATHTGGGFFAIPGGARPGGFLAEGLFDRV